MTDAGEDLTPAEAFRLLGNEHRVAILLAMADAGLLGYRGDPPSFSELYESVPIEDSANFNYHLQQLTGHFVEPVESGYVLRYPGRKVMRAVKAGLYTDDPAFEEAAIDGECPRCGAVALVAGYDGTQLGVACEGCETPLTANRLPPGGFTDRDVTEVMHAFDRTVRHRVRMAVDGVCYECSGPMAAAVATDLPPEWGYEALPVYECGHCEFWVMPSFGMALLAVPDAVQFLRDQVDPMVRERPYWELDLCVTDDYTTVESRDPWTVTVSVPGDDERLTARFEDGALERLTIEGH